MVETAVVFQGSTHLLNCNSAGELYVKGGSDVVGHVVDGEHGTEIRIDEITLAACLQKQASNAKGISVRRRSSAHPAIQWTGDNESQIKEWMGEHPEGLGLGGIIEFHYAHDRSWITFGNQPIFPRVCNQFDWIVAVGTGAHLEYVLCSSETFNTMFEIVPHN